MNKTCSCCLTERPISDFQKRTASKDGLTASCKSCLKKRDAEKIGKAWVFSDESLDDYLREEIRKQTAERRMDGKAPTAYTRTIRRAPRTPPALRSAQ